MRTTYPHFNSDFRQRWVCKKALTHMQENSLAQARVYAATLGQFVIALVKSADVDNERALGSTFHKTEKDHCTLYQISFGMDMSKKEESTLTE